MTTWHAVTTAQGRTWHPSYGAACAQAKRNGGTIARGTVPSAIAEGIAREASLYLAAVAEFRAEGSAPSYTPEVSEILYSNRKGLSYA